MTASNDGGPAFPVFPETGNGHAAAIHGLSVRQWYAGQALATMTFGFRDIPKQCAINAFAIADAMLAYEANESGGRKGAA